MLEPRCLESVAFLRPAFCHSARSSWSPSLPYMWSPSQHSGPQVTKLQSTVGQAAKELHSLKITSIFHFPLTKHSVYGKYQNLTLSLRALLRPSHSACPCHGNKPLSIASQGKRHVGCVALRNGQDQSTLQAEALKPEEDGNTSSQRTLPSAETNWREGYMWWRNHHKGEAGICSLEQWDPTSAA